MKKNSGSALQTNIYFWDNKRLIKFQDAIYVLSTSSELMSTKSTYTIKPRTKLYVQRSRIKIVVGKGKARGLTFEGLVGLYDLKQNSLRALVCLKLDLYQ